MAANVFGAKQFKPVAPDKGSFPLDHEGSSRVEVTPSLSRRPKWRKFTHEETGNWVSYIGRTNFSVYLWNPVLWIRDILVRIQIRGSVTLTKGFRFGSGSCFLKFFAYYFFRYISSVKKKSKNSRNQVFFTFSSCWWKDADPYKHCHECHHHNL